MKTRSYLDSQSNIASIVKGRRHVLFTEPETVSFTQLNSESLSGAVASTSNPNINNENSNPPVVQHCLPEKKVIIKTLWSLEDKIMFFTALKNYGKNFDEISRFMKNRCSRLNPKRSGKTKEQVRFFYNRTWNNIKPYLKFPVELPQSVQELYALINYSVFRTRIKKTLNPKLGDKLNEMVMNGSTVIKCNGKRITLRTPVCPALKKINNIKVPDQEYTIPDDVTIEMVPRNYVSLWRVQQIEQNPRMRLKVSMNRQLSDVIHFLSNKLKSNSQIIRESLSLPAVDVPKLHIRLNDDSKFLKEVLLQEITKPRFDNITLKSYRDNILKANVEQSIDKDPERSQPSTSNQGTDTEASYLKMDFGEIERKLLAGVGLEDAREVKILSLYIGLGCPSVIKFMYEYLNPSDVDTAEKSVSNGLRRMLHLGKHDFLEYENNKDTKNKLEQEILDMQNSLAQLKQQYSKMETFNFVEPGVPISHQRNHMNNNQNSRQDVYKKQQEALQQLIEDLPNKNNVVVKQVEFAQEGNSIESLKRFHKSRKNQRSVNKNKASASAVYTLKMPLTLQDSHYQDNVAEQVDVMPTVNVGHSFQGISNLFSSSNDDIFLQAGLNSHQSLFNTQAQPTHNQNNGAPLDHCDNTNDSLRSYFFEVDDHRQMDFQNLYPSPYFGVMSEDGASVAEGKHEVSTTAFINNDSNSASLSNIFNCYVKTEKKS